MNTMLDMDRRSMLERMAWLLGAAALPAEALAKPAARAKRFLDPARENQISQLAMLPPGAEFR